jgi:hypothetical protein
MFSACSLCCKYCYTKSAIILLELRVKYIPSNGKIILGLESIHKRQPNHYAINTNYQQDRIYPHAVDIKFLISFEVRLVIPKKVKCHLHPCTLQLS